MACLGAVVTSNVAVSPYQGQAQRAVQKAAFSRLPAQCVSTTSRHSTVLTNEFKGLRLPPVVSLDKRDRSNAKGGALSARSNANAVYSLNWVLVLSSVFLMLAAQTNVYKQILVPLTALHMPREVIGWMRGEYGMWIATVAVLVRLFYGIPGQLELPFATFLLIAVAPNNLLAFRREPAAALICLLMALYAGYSHYTHFGNKEDALNSPVLGTTVAITSIVVISAWFLLRSYRV